MTKKQSLPVVNVEPSDLTLVRGDGETIQTFLKGIVAFFARARRLEDDAVATLTMAQALTLPTSMEEDASIQRFVRQTTTDRKEVESHWSICQTVSGVHRRLTTARGRAVNALEQANQIANGLHNRYVDAERRRAAEEQERRRREAEELARRDREAQLAKLEAEAVAREEASPELSEREQRFVELVCSEGRFVSSAEAARSAGYKDYAKQGDRLRAMPKIQQAIDAILKAREIRRQVAAQRTAPLEVHAEAVKPQIAKTGGFDRTTWSAEVLDEVAFIEAVFAGKSGIPRDVLTINQTKLNEYARSLHERLDLWPGVRAKKTTSVV